MPSFRVGPAYSAKASRSGIRAHNLFDPTFADKFRKIVEGRNKRYGYFEYDTVTEGEIKRYQVNFSNPSNAHAGAHPPFNQTSMF